MHLAQLRDNYEEFTARNAEIVVVGPEDRESFLSQWSAGAYPFVGLPDPDHRVADLYEQEVKLLRLGRLPALMLVDVEGRLRHQHYGGSMRDIPKIDDTLALLDGLNERI